MKYSIAQKQQLINKLKDEDNFDKDLDLFAKKFPRHALNRELANINKYNKDRLQSKVIYYLLDVVTSEDIENNRNGVTPIEETPIEETPTEGTPTEETPIEETPIEETPTEETPIEETPIEETPIEGTPIEETPIEGTPTEETPIEEVKKKEESKKSSQK